MDEITWFALLLNFENDTLNIYGSISKEQVFIEKYSDTIVFQRLYGDDLWSIILTKDRKTISLFKNDIPEHKFSYRRMTEFEKQYIKIDETDYFSIDKGVKELFNIEFLSGKYLYKNKDTIIFKKNGELANFENYKNYEIDNYFGTCHFFGNLDNLTLISDNSRETWHWKFENEFLILNKIKPKNNDYEQGFYLTNEIIKLKKIESP